MDVTPAAQSEFRADLRASSKAWRVAPLLPLISVGLALATLVPQPWWWFVLPALIMSFGWVGSERIWYLRIYRDEPISARELLRMTRAFFWRFVRLGLVSAIALLPALIIALPRFIDDPEDEDLLASPPAWIAVALGTAVIYFSLTFVTPALSYSTTRVRIALRLGFRMLRDHWPRTAGYAVVPPVVVVITYWVSQSASFALPGQLALTSATTLFHLWLKGATAAFYLRRVEVDREGAAFMPDERASEASALTGGR